MVESVSMRGCVQEDGKNRGSLHAVDGLLADGPRASRGRAEIRPKSQGLARSLPTSRTAFPIWGNFLKINF